MPRNSRQFSVTLRPALDAAVEAYATLHKCSKSQVVNDALLRYGELKPFMPKLPKPERSAPVHTDPWPPEGAPDYEWDAWVEALHDGTARMPDKNIPDYYMVATEAVRARRKNRK